MDEYQPIIEVLQAARRVLVTTHVRPDGDALGSTAAMVMGLRALGIGAQVLLLSHLPEKYAFVYTENDIPFTDADAGIPADFDLSAFDCLLVIDTGTWSQLPGLKDRLTTFKGAKMVVDHHLTQEGWADRKLVQTAAGAAGEIVAELLQRMNVPLTGPMATALFLAIVSDTGWFQFSSARPCTLRLAARLMEAGVDHDQLYQRLYQNEHAQRLALQSRAVQGVQLVGQGRVAVMGVSQNDFRETGASMNDTENLINLPLQIGAVQASILLVEPAEGGAIRVSLRSKGQIDVARVAEQFGGGGHARAAGLKIAGSLESARERVVKSVVERLTSAAT